MRMLHGEALQFGKLRVTLCGKKRLFGVDSTLGKSSGSQNKPKNTPLFWGESLQ
jgi:hypothetical protein